jgi:hypothetical protein
MPPFIKFTRTEQGLNGLTRKLKFINTAFIREAEFDEEEKILEVVVGSSPDRGGESHYLHGQEAEDALAIFQSLNRPK